MSKSVHGGEEILTHMVTKRELKELIDKERPCYHKEKGNCRYGVGCYFNHGQVKVEKVQK